MWSCLALRYEGLNFRESRTMNHPELHVSYGEWMNFAEDAFNNSFYSVTAKVYYDSYCLYNACSGFR